MFIKSLQFALWGKKMFLRKMYVVRVTAGNINVTCKCVNICTAVFVNKCVNFNLRQTGIQGGGGGSCFKYHTPPLPRKNPEYVHNIEVFCCETFLDLYFSKHI